jgi:nucleoside-diphosphate-sugar epimerase
LNLVTGGAGFIGSAVVRHLLERGLPVRVVDDRSKVSAAEVQAPVEYVEGSVSDPAVAREAFSDVDTCFHLAAKIGGIGYFHRYPADILDDNNHMLSTVFRTATEVGSKVVYVSSSMVFERTRQWPTPEEAVDLYPPPFSAYGFSKLIGEWYCRAFNEQFGTRFCIARPFNAYGPGEFPEDEPGLAHVIPDLIRKIVSGEREIAVFGDGSQTRSFTFVDDVAEAIVEIGLREEAEGDEFNIGTGVETSIRDVLQLVWEACGRGGEPMVRSLPALPVDVQRRVPDVSKIRTILGWTATVPIEQGIRRTVEWYVDARRDPATSETRS